ncbi:hypothetical protein [Flavobacterium sp. M31R6]|uniref:hypothetical protein n=1 Tax=Flavobacterium sp. M31R6 TaxID=2739062 RepID=UPI001568F1B5|nr:hypothetical protein [Flavobacterium sp. M31R6]QKJ61732.1 hypothetical protein HQN62_00880 [Flavobacterium sp. M31R6]
MWGYLIKYSDFYANPIPENPIDLILDIPKEELIATLVAINTRLKRPDSNHFDDSRETQIECLKTIFLDKNNPVHLSFCRTLINRYSLTPKNHNLFSRVTCLYAMQEIINNEGFTSEEPEYNFDNRERIFKFLLIANEQILTGDKNYREEGYKQLGTDFFEFFMFRELHHNQYNECSNAINIFYKSYFLFNKIEQHHLFGKHFKNFITWFYKVESTKEFLKHIIWTFIKSYDEVLGMRYINIPKDNVDAIKILDSFSTKVEYPIPTKDDLRTFDFFPLKKSPLFKCKIKENKDIVSYIMYDEGFYIEKTYSIFINDFWFDYLKPNEVCTRKDWGNFIGTDFYEPFTEDILKESFSTRPDIILKSTNQLQFNIEGTEIEYADFYIREKQNVALFEVKSGFIPLDHGYKTVATIEDFKNLDTEKFNKDYGLSQLAEKTLKKFHIYKSEIDDLHFNYQRKVQIYPIIIVNDPIVSSGIVPFVLKRKFNELLEKQKINKKTKEHNIKDLIIINISDLQEMEQSLKDKKIDFFGLLELYLSMSDYTNKANHKGYNFLRTFNYALAVQIKDGLIPNRIKDIKWLED